jgi:hypothetical protein
MPTKKFFKNFGGRFSEETGGGPNGAMTFRHKDTDVFEGPLIAVYVEAAYQKRSGKYVYELSQSKDQGDIDALDDFFQDGDEVEYESCSMFIDNDADNEDCMNSPCYETAKSWSDHMKCWCENCPDFNKNNPDDCDVA